LVFGTKRGTLLIISVESDLGLGAKGSIWEAGKHQKSSWSLMIHFSIMFMFSLWFSGSMILCLLAYFCSLLNNIILPYISRSKLMKPVNAEMPSFPSTGTGQFLLENSRSPVDLDVYG
jgi:uncharacterized membrane protein YjjP (DUF1212 family)